MSAKPLSFSLPSGRMVCPLRTYRAGCAAGRLGVMHVVRATIVTLMARWWPPNWSIHGVVSRGRADKGDVVLVESELNTAATPPRAGLRAARRALASAGASAAGVLQHLVAVHDVGDLLVARAAQRGRDHGQRGLALRRRQVAHPQAIALKDSARQVRPSGALLRAVEVER